METIVLVLTVYRVLLDMGGGGWRGWGVYNFKYFTKGGFYIFKNIKKGGTIGFSYMLKNVTPHPMV